jgi:hypothetical protein
MGKCTDLLDNKFELLFIILYVHVRYKLNILTYKR